MRIIKFIDKLLNFILIIFCITVIAFSGYALYDVQTVYNDAKLSEDILKYRPTEQCEDNTQKFKLADLQNEINEDICGWVRIDGTNIDYPILYPHTSLEYLDKDYKKNYSPAGSIFIDYKNDRLFSDDYTVIYGHNMAEKMMFSDIKEFKELSFFEKHQTGKLYTGEHTYNISIYSVNVLDSNKDIAYKVEQYKNEKNAELLENFKNSAIHRNTYEVNPENKFIILTTCNGAGTSQRAVLFCILEESNITDTINEDTDSDIERDEKIKEKNKKTSANKNYQHTENKTEKKKKYNAKIDKAMYYIKRSLRDPTQVSLYILILITIIIYIIAIKKKIKRKTKSNSHPKVKRKPNNKEYIAAVEYKETLKIEKSKEKTNVKSARKRGKGKHC